MKVAVVDMQPILPAVGGGRQRLLGLYHALGPSIECTYVGSYDWPGEPFRDQQITPGLREIVVPLSPEHHAAAKALAAQMDGRTVIDIAFPDQVYLSPEFLRVAREHVATADVVVFSHPWCYPPLADDLQPGQLVVYDSHNVEAVLRTSLLDDLPQSRELLTRVADVEYALCRRADLVLACSQDDVNQYQQIMDVDPFCLRIVPNGAFTGRFIAMPRQGQSSQRQELGLPSDRPIAIFMGSLYGPNVEAAKFIARTLAPQCQGWCFVIVGGAGEPLQSESIPENLKITGRVDDAHRDALLIAADIALNPMMTGSGTNIKMFDYMAAGLPILTTDVGARGICTSSSAPEGIWVEPTVNFPSRCATLLSTLPFPAAWKTSVREAVQRRFSWEAISPALGTLLTVAHRSHTTRTGARPRVAVMSTWNVTCGIGEYASYLINGFSDAGADTLVLGNDLANHEPLGFAYDLHTPVSRVWTWDNIHWRDSRIDIKHFERELQLGHPDLLVVQHHTGFVPFGDLHTAVSVAQLRGIPVLVEMHDDRYVTDEQKELLCASGANLLIHDAESVEHVAGPTRKRVHVFHHPVHAPRINEDVVPTKQKKGFIIGGFGFLRPYKGLLVTVQTLALLKAQFPHITYRGWHALYPGDSSEDYYLTCLKEAEKLGVMDDLDIDTRFLPIEDVISELRTVDVVIMPYDPSNEGASGAANIALAAGAAIVTSPSAIFQSLDGVVQNVGLNAPIEYAAAISKLLRSPAQIREMKSRARTWAEEHSYVKAARSLLCSFLTDSTRQTRVV